MQKFFVIITATLLVITGVAAKAAQESASVDVTTFIRAETDRYMARYVAQGAFGNFLHVREPVRVEHQDVIRMNRDTLYSFGVFDLSHTVTIHKPDTKGRFQSLLAINQDHYVVSLEHQGGSFTFTRESVGTDYLVVLIRTFMDPDDPEDLKAAHGWQDALTVEQAETGSFDVPNWDETSLDRTRGLLLALAADYRGTSEGAFGTREEVDPIKHLIATAAGWGGNPEHASMYIAVIPEQNEGNVPHTLTVSDVPVDGFWSVTVYNEDGFMEANPSGIYSMNNITSKTNPDGGVTLHFGACDDGRINCIPTPENWSYNVRLYQPRNEVLDGSWTFPEAVPVD